MDVGFQKGADDNAVKGWQIIAQYKIPGRKTPGFLSEQKAGSLVKGIRVAGAAYITMEIPGAFGIPQNTVAFTVNARDYGGVMPGSSVGVMNVSFQIRNFSYNDYNYFSFKRANSIAQDASSVGKNNGYSRSGSYVRYSGWGNIYDPEESGCSLDGNPWQTYDTLHSGAYPGRGSKVNWHDGYKFYEEDGIGIFCIS